MDIMATIMATTATITATIMATVMATQIQFTAVDIRDLVAVFQATQ